MTQFGTNCPRHSSVSRHYWMHLGLIHAEIGKPWFLLFADLHLALLFFLLQRDPPYQLILCTILSAGVYELHIWGLNKDFPVTRDAYEFIDNRMEEEQTVFFFFFGFRSIVGKNSSSGPFHPKLRVTPIYVEQLFFVFTLALECERCGFEN